MLSCCCGTAPIDERVYRIYIYIYCTIDEELSFKGACHVTQPKLTSDGTNKKYTIRKKKREGKDETREERKVRYSLWRRFSAAVRKGQHTTTKKKSMTDFRAGVGAYCTVHYYTVPQKKKKK